MRVKIFSLFVVVAVGALGCTSEEKAPAEPKAEEPKEAAPAPEPEPEAVAAADPAAEAETIFSQRCAVCHGAGGKGDGAGSAALEPKPRDFTSAQWQASVTDEHIAKIIVKGGPAVGMAPTMVANPDLEAKPEVVAKLVEHIRGLKE